MSNTASSYLVLVGGVEWDLTDFLVSLTECSHVAHTEFNGLQQSRLRGITVTLPGKKKTL